MKKLLPLAVVIGMLVAACGSDSDGTPTATPTEVFNGPAASPTEPANANPSSTPTLTPTPTTAIVGATASPTGPAPATPTSTAMASGGTATPGLPSFTNAADLNTVNDFVSHFELLEYKWSDGGAAMATYRMEYLGTETVGGVETDHLKMTLSDGSGQTSSEVWTDNQGNVKKLVMDGQEVPAEQLAMFAPLAITAFFAPLSAVPDLSEIDSTYMTPGGKYTVTSTETGTKTFGDVTADTWTMHVDVTGQGKGTWEVSDFGEVSLFTSMRFEQTTGDVGAFSFEVTEVKLR